MTEDLLVQFVRFETPLDAEEFIVKWDQFNRSVGNQKVTLQQSKKKDLFRYVVQQRCMSDQFQYIVEKKRKPSKIPEVSIRTELAGGYSILQLDRKAEARSDESKLFVFIPNARVDLDFYRNLKVRNKLNIYQPYYENCRYAYILEFFVKDDQAEELLLELTDTHNGTEAGIYKECRLQ